MGRKGRVAFQYEGSAASGVVYVFLDDNGAVGSHRMRFLAQQLKHIR